MVIKILIWKLSVELQVFCRKDKPEIAFAGKSNVGKSS